MAIEKQHNGETTDSNGVGINNGEGVINNNEGIVNTIKGIIIANQFNKVGEKAKENEEKKKKHEEMTKKQITLGEKIASMQQECDNKDSTILSLEKKLKEILWPIARDGTLRWNVDNFAQSSNAAVEGSQTFLMSDDFFTPEGHRFCALVYLHGHGPCKGRSLSLYVAIKKGRKDADITWPLPYKNITFQIRCQGSGKHWEKNLPVDPQDQRFYRPVEEQNEKIGFEDLIDLDRLERPENQFIVEDKMCVMITVE